eukprot:scaffold2836_cov95-Skeletonema_marinoi.AAC.7
MNEDNQVDTSSCCASCGIAQVDELKLMECTDCDLVKYCSDACQKNHISQHEQACNKRAAELREEILFKQPESSHDGDCPICCLPLPLDLSSLDESKSTLMSCCSKLICEGCSHANQVREAKALMPRPTCPFCRKPVPSSKHECDRNRMKRIEAKDPLSMCSEGLEQQNKGDYSSAFRYFTKAAELGDMGAHYQLAGLYRKGRGVEKDEGMEMYHLEEAAIGGHPDARYIIGCHGWNNDNNESAVKHWIIAANLGHDGSIKSLMDAFRMGFIGKEELAATLRAHKAAVDATKSPQREAAENYRRALGVENSPAMVRAALAISNTH